MGKHMDKPDGEWNFSGRSVCCDFAQITVPGHTTPMLYWQTFMVDGGMVPRRIGLVDWCYMHKFQLGSFFIWSEVKKEKDQQIGMGNDGFGGGLLWLQMGLTSGGSRVFWNGKEAFLDCFCGVFEGLYL